jgi:protein gp37
LEEPLRAKKPSIIAPVPTGDLFGQHVGDILEILRVIRDAPWHIFAILTKLPAVASLTSYPENVMFGVTVNQQEDTWRLDNLRQVRASYKWAIFEPLYGPIKYDLSWLDWIVIGPQSRPSFQPKKEWVDLLLQNAKDVPVFMKSSLAFEPKLRQPPKVEVRFRAP